MTSVIGASRYDDIMFGLSSYINDGSYKFMNWKDILYRS
jgi:hypothetical protein